MATYTPEELSGQGTPTEALTAGTEYVFTLLSSNILLGSAYFTFETVRNANGFYDSTSPTNAVGTLDSASGVQNPIQDLYIFSEVINSITSSFTFTPTENVAVSSSYLRTTGGVSLDITPSGPVVTPFQMTVDTTETGTSSNTSMTIPFAAGTFTDCVVDWGDSTTTTVTTSGNVTHDYGATTTAAVIKISGAFPGLLFNNGGDKLKLSSIDTWGTNVFTALTAAFRGCSNMVGTFTDYPNLGTITNLSRMFENCTAFNSNLVLNTSLITDISFMFSGCTNFNGNLSSWDTSNVTNFQESFIGCTNLTTLSTLNSWDVSSGTNFSYMFQQCVNFNGDLSLWRTTSAIVMNSMFYNCQAFPGNVNDWGVSSSATNLSYMFFTNSVFNSSDLTLWDVSNVTNMALMFEQCSIFSGDVSSWRPAKCTNFTEMFYQCFAFNSDISGWVFNATGATINMSYMLGHTTVFDQNIGSWNIQYVNNFASFMVGKTPSTFSSTNLDAIYNGWSALTVQSGVTITFGTAKYNASSQAGRDILTGGTNVWNITDGGVV